MFILFCALAVVNMAITERGFELTKDGATVRILVTTILPNIRKLSPELHLDAKIIQSHLAAVRHRYN